MVFVNEIAEVVHSTVDFYSGASNKNIGDAFLLVWKFEDEDVESDPYSGVLTVKKDSVRVKSLAELAVLSFIKIQPALARSNKLRKYRQNKELVERMQDTGGFKVRMGFGLHVGWAIEGAIGSKYKIDASYLSPHVNISARLEAATKQFGVSMLVSERVRELVRDPLKSMMRQLDCIKVKGSDVDLPVYTIDLDVSEYFYVSQTDQPQELTGIEKKKERMKLRKQRDMLKERLYTGQISIKTLVLKDQDIVIMRKRFQNDFFREWNAGINSYLRGDWKTAKDRLSKTRHMVIGFEDKPSETILAYMESYNFESPKDWTGVRALTEK